MAGNDNFLLHQRILLIIIMVALIQPVTPASAQIEHYATSHTTGIMRGEVEVTRTDAAFEGYNLFVLRERGRANRQNNQTLIITDMNGNVEYERIITNGGTFELADLSVEFVSPTTLLVGYPFNVALVNIYTGATELLGFYGHHEYEYNPNNKTVFTFRENEEEIEGSMYIFDLINEYDLDGNLVWSLDVSEFITPDMQCPYSHLVEGVPDVAHSNTIFYDTNEDVIYYNPRNVNTFYKIDHKTGDVIWGLGEYGDFAMYDAFGIKVDYLFFHSHSLERIDDDTFILFDNDFHNKNLERNHKSRIIEITIDEGRMEANASWIWRGTDRYWSIIWGDADRLPNGNRLGAFGADDRPGFFNEGAHLIEVTEDGEIAWKFTFKNNDMYTYGIYRMERFRYTPILLSPTQLHFEPDEDVILNWEAFYNYRPKRMIEGDYTLTGMSARLDSGTFLYDRFWRPA
ncbi:MAG: aryl-sulfate sulfotransferase, partial [Promethearchaeota archaeon]